MDLDEYEILHSDVLQLIEWIRTDIENAAALDRYKRKLSICSLNMYE